MGRDLFLAYGPRAAVRGVAMVGCIAALLGACRPNPVKSSEAEAPQPQAQAEVPPRSATPSAPRAAPVVLPVPATVTVASNGAEPRRVLSVEPGDRATYLVRGELKTSTINGSGGSGDKTSSIDISFEARTGLRRGGPQTSMLGVVPQRVTVKASAGIEGTDELRVGERSDRTKTAVVQVSRDGRHGRAIFMNGFGPISRPAAASLIADAWMWAAPVFPLEPVGAGAQWRAESTVAIPGGEAIRQATFDVVSMSAKEVRLKVSVAERFSKAKVDGDNPLKTADYEAHVTADWTVPTGEWPGTGKFTLKRVTTFDNDGTPHRLVEETTANFR